MKDKCCGEKLIAVGTAIAFQIAQKYPPESLAILGSLLTIVGDQLSLLSITKACDSSSNEEQGCK